MYKNYAIKGDQMAAIKEVERALKKAQKAGVHFWDNYGRLSAYNADVINCPVPDQNEGPELDQRMTYDLRVNNFHAGNADDTLYVSFK